jgi:hypothetical protein
MIGYASGQNSDTPNYFPLSVGNNYVRYESSTVPPLPSTPTIFAGDLVVRDSFEIHGKQYFYFPGIYFGNDTITAAIGGKVYYHHQGKDQLYYDFTASVGQTWQPTLPFSSTQSVNCTATLQSKTDTVQVTAGRFTKCVRIKFKGVGTSLEWTDWLAPGVGLVFHGSQIPWELHEAVVNGIGYPGLVGILGTSSIAEFRLYQNYPNPFNPETLFKYQISRAGSVGLTVFDVAGRQVVRLVEQRQSAGSYILRWDGRDDNGRSVPSGAYTCRLVVGNTQQAIKLLKVK